MENGVNKEEPRLVICRACDLHWESGSSRNADGEPDSWRANKVTKNGHKMHLFICRALEGGWTMSVSYDYQTCRGSQCLHLFNFSEPEHVHAAMETAVQMSEELDDLVGPKPC